MAPAATLLSTLPLLASTISTTPMVPTVPKEVPSRKDTIQLKRKAESIKYFALIKAIA